MSVSDRESRERLGRILAVAFVLVLFIGPGPGLRLSLESICIYVLVYDYVLYVLTTTY